MEQINLNLIPNGVNPVAHCKQYDVGRTFRCNLFEGNSVYTLDGTETVECEVHKPDGNLVTLALTNTGSTYVDVTTTLQMCACSGESLAAIKITSGGVEIGSLNFVLYCERSPLEGGITSDSGIYNLETQVSSLVATEVANQYDSANVIFDASPVAGHGNGYAVTSEGILDYVNPEETIENVSIASFDNGGDGVPVKELIVGIEPVQASGTPTPSSPLAITGWTNANVYVASKNLYDGTEMVSVGNNWQAKKASGIFLKAGVTYTAKIHSATAPTFMYMRELGQTATALVQTNNGIITYTPSENVTVWFDNYWSGGNGKPATAPDFQLEIGNTATTYHAGASTTSTIALGQTVYGGELNVTTGELTITHGTTTLDSTWYWTKGNTQPANNNCFFTTNFVSMPNTTNAISSHFKQSSVQYVSGMSDNQFIIGNNDGRIYVTYGTSVTTPAEFKTWLSNNTVTVCYELETPTTTTLTPTEVATILGYNNIYADTGDVVSVTYIKDFASAIYPIVEDKKVDKPSSGSPTYYGTWSPLYNGYSYLFVPLVGASSMQNRITVSTFNTKYSTDGTTWSYPGTVYFQFNDLGIRVYTDDTNAVGCVGSITIVIS